MLVVLGVVFLLVFVIYYMGFFLAVVWRKALTEWIHQRYITGKMYYNLNCIDKSVDNPYVINIHSTLIAINEWHKMYKHWCTTLFNFLSCSYHVGYIEKLLGRFFSHSTL